MRAISAVEPLPPVRSLRHGTAGPGQAVEDRPLGLDASAFDRGAGAMNRPSRFDAVIFDCDGVLVDSEGIAEEVWAEMAAELGGGHTAQDAMRRFRGERFASCLEWLESADRARPLPARFEREFRVRTRERFARDLRPIPGVADMLRALPAPLLRRLERPP